MSETMLLLPILVPVVAGLLVLLTRAASAWQREGITLAATLAQVVMGAFLFGHQLKWEAAWAGYGLTFALRLDTFSSFILLATAGFGLLVSLYSCRFMRDRANARQYYAYLLISLGMTAGAVVADHLVVLLFFWEGLLVTLFGMIAIGRPSAFRAATKAFIIVGVTDLCLMLGIALTGKLAGTLVMSKIAATPVALTGLGPLAMIAMMIGAMSKAGAMPFHSWIPDAAVEAPLPFMAFLPASLEKLLGIYLLARISLELFAFTTASWVSVLMMSVGAVTILFAVMMALVQKDYKRLLAYHAISQVGYMVLGIGTAVPIGIVGGLFHMINHAMYKSCLFLTGGAVEKQAGTTDLAKLGGLARRMPVTFACFIVAAASICGVPPFNGFFSKELVYDAALDRHVIFYLAAILGSFFTAASFLKLGHAAYLGPRDARNDKVREAPLSMLVPMIVIASLCILFGVYNALPLRHLVQPAVPDFIRHGADFAGWPARVMLVVLTVVALGGALLNHLLGANSGGSGLHAADHIRYSAVLAPIYERAERRFFDPYDAGLKAAGFVAAVAWRLDRAVDWIYNGLAVAIVSWLSRSVRLAHNGDYAMYLLWSLAGTAILLVFLMYSL